MSDDLCRDCYGLIVCTCGAVDRTADTLEEIRDLLKTLIAEKQGPNCPKHGIGGPCDWHCTWTPEQWRTGKVNP